MKISPFYVLSGLALLGLFLAMPPVADSSLVPTEKYPVVTDFQTVQLLKDPALHARFTVVYDGETVLDTTIKGHDSGSTLPEFVSAHPHQPGHTAVVTCIVFDAANQQIGQRVWSKAHENFDATDTIPLSIARTGLPKGSALIDCTCLAKADNGRLAFNFQ